MKNNQKLEQFKPTRSQGLLRLESFKDSMDKDYENLRNYDLGPEDRSNVSLLSPYVSSRLVLEEEIVTLVLEEYGINRANKFVQEVFWRSYFKGWLELRPIVWKEYCQSLNKLKSSMLNDKELYNKYQKACNGKTEYECFNAWVNELVNIGYLHNHARMWFASIWIFYLELPWELGADFFYRHLLDGDCASNTLSWRWVAGLHTNGKNYIASAENIKKFTNNRFNPKNLKLTSIQTKPSDIKHASISTYVSSPINFRYENKDTIIIVYDGDLLIEKSELKKCKPSLIVGLSPFLIQKDAKYSEQVLKFKELALKDAIKRAKEYFNVESKIISLSDELEILIKNSSHFSFIRPRVGFWVEIFYMIKNGTAKFTEIERNWDVTLYPLAVKGFFSFKKHFPNVFKVLKLVPEI